MRLDDQRESQNVEDRRGGGGGGFGGRFGGGLGGGLGGAIGPLIIGRLLGRGGLGIGGVLLLLVLAFCSGQFGDLTGGGEVAAPRQGAVERQAAAPARGGEAADAERRFVSRVLASTEDVWGEVFRAGGQQAYRAPILVLFEDQVRSGCGTAQASTGPFYCPADQRLYLDLSFFREMARSLGARGDFAWAYVIAHEVGHHVQNLLGILPRVDAQRRNASERDGNLLQVRLELQADCFAGVWANRARNLLEQGDVEEGLNAAAAVGDDRLQRRGGGMVVPDSFTHGSSAQRAGWFRRGLDQGDVRACDTFTDTRR